MRLPVERQHTLEEYFGIEESSGVKHEFYHGHILAMPGASLRHNRIMGNIFGRLRTALADSACEVFASDLRVRTPSGLYTYPDVMVVCNGVELSPTDRLDTVINPTLIVGVTSPSTVAYDRGGKFRLYQACQTLREYVLVDQSARFVEVYTRPGPDSPASDWRREEYTVLTKDVLLASVPVTLSLSDIYVGVEPTA